MLSGYLDIHRSRIIVLLAVPGHGPGTIALGFPHVADKFRRAVSAESLEYVRPGITAIFDQPGNAIRQQCHMRDIINDAPYRLVRPLGG